MYTSFNKLVIVPLRRMLRDQEVVVNLLLIYSWEIYLPVKVCHNENIIHHRDS